MKTQDLVKLNLDELEAELAKGSFSKSFLDSLLKAEKSGKDRSGAVELIEGAIAALDDEQDLPIKSEVDTAYFVADSVQCISFGFAGNKAAGEEINTDWHDFKQNEGLLASLIARGLVVLKAKE